MEEGESKGDEFLPGRAYYAGEMSRKGRSKKEFSESAAFEEDTMVGKLNGDETRMMLIGRGKLEEAFYLPVTLTRINTYHIIDLTY